MDTGTRIAVDVVDVANSKEYIEIGGYFGGNSRINDKLVFFDAASAVFSPVSKVSVYPMRSENLLDAVIWTFGLKLSVWKPAHPLAPVLEFADGIDHTAYSPLAS